MKKKKIIGLIIIIVISFLLGTQVKIEKTGRTEITISDSEILQSIEQSKYLSGKGTNVLLMSASEKTKNDNSYLSENSYLMVLDDQNKVIEKVKLDDYYSNINNTPDYICLYSTVDNVPNGTKLSDVKYEFNNNELVKSSMPCEDVEKTSSVFGFSGDGIEIIHDSRYLNTLDFYFQKNGYDFYGSDFIQTINYPR
ncbi:MAG: hypothetical protein ACRCUP_03235 [Mycoplasmatales bacterium]